MKALKLLILLTIHITQAWALVADPSHLVIIKTKHLTYNIERSATRAARYAHVRKVMDKRFQQELIPFTQSINSDRTIHDISYLPIISGVAMTLNEAQLKELRSHPSVYDIYPNGRVQFDEPSQMTPVRPNRTSDVVLNDALMLHKVDELITSGIDIHRPGKVVGIIDTGADGNHPDVASKIISFLNFTNGSTIASDSANHGTHVAGIIAGGNTSGTQIGVYPGAKLIVASALSSQAHLLKALQWMLDPDGNPSTQDQPFVINNSWNSGFAKVEPFYIALQALKDADILVCFSAGNAGQSGITPPKEFPATFTSAAVTKDATIAAFSSWGPALYRGTQMLKPEVASMGVDVISTIPRGKYAKMSGTSMASPFTAGAIALLGAHFPNLSPYVIAEVLAQTAESSVRIPWDKQYGNGIINVYKAYLALKQQ